MKVETTAVENNNSTSLKLSINEILKGVIDPELSMNIVDLNMVKGIEIDRNSNVTIKVALTIASCPLRSQIEKDVINIVSALPKVNQVKVEIGSMTQEEKSMIMNLARKEAQNRTKVKTDISPNARILAISSGKGGVGKSSVTVNLAKALASNGMKVGILDADISGFSIPKLLGINTELKVSASKKILPIEIDIESGQLKVVSMGFLANEDDAIMWRGLMLSRAVQHFLEDVTWGDVDYLLIDTPPGTSDVQMAIARMLPTTELIIITTPPDQALQVASRAAQMARKSNLRVGGIIENMSYFTCEHGQKYYIFGSGGGKKLSEKLGVPLIGEIPIVESVSDSLETPHNAKTLNFLTKEYGTIAQVILNSIAPPIKMNGCSARLAKALDKL